MDYVQDHNPKPLYRVEALLGGLPDYVATAEVLTKAATVGWTGNAFADPISREFPIFDKAATWLSYAYFRGAGRSGQIATIIKAAGAHFGISEDLVKIDTALATQKQASAPEPVFALPAGSVADHPDTSFYPIGNSGDIEDSAMRLVNDRRNLSLNSFYKAATAIVEASKAFADVSLPEVVKVAGTRRTPDFKVAKEVALRRGRDVGDPEMAQLYADIVKAAEEGTDSAEDLVEVWEELDAVAGVKYARGVVDPHAALFSGPTEEFMDKLASETLLIDDVLVPAAAIASIPRRTIEDRFLSAHATQVLEWQKLAATNAPAANAKVQELGSATRTELIKLAVAHG